MFRPLFLSEINYYDVLDNGFSMAIGFIPDYGLTVQVYDSDGQIVISGK